MKYGGHMKNDHDEFVEQLKFDLYHGENLMYQLNSVFLKQTIDYMRDWAQKPLLDYVLDIEYEKIRLLTIVHGLYRARTMSHTVPTEMIIAWAKILGRLELKFHMWKKDNSA